MKDNNKINEKTQYTTPVTKQSKMKDFKISKFESGDIDNSKTKLSQELHGGSGYNDKGSIGTSGQTQYTTPVTKQSKMKDFKISKFESGDLDNSKTKLSQELHGGSGYNNKGSIGTSGQTQYTFNKQKIESNNVVYKSNESHEKHSNMLHKEQWDSQFQINTKKHSVKDKVTEIEMKRGADLLYLEDNKKPLDLLSTNNYTDNVNELDKYLVSCNGEDSGLEA